MTQKNDRLSKSFIAFSIFAASHFWGCGAGIPGLGRNPQEEKIDRLIMFKEAVSLRNFAKAARILSPEDSSQIVDSSGSVPEEMQNRLRAVKLRTLVNQEDVRVRDGRLSGVVARLPILEQGESIIIEEVFELEGDAGEALSEKEQRMLKVRKASQILFEAIAAEEWQDALNTLHPASREVFLTRAGKLKPGVRSRLSQVDTASWRALTLRKGKLIGVVLLIPPPVPGLERAAAEFFQAIRRGDWESIKAVLITAEHEKLVEPDGGISEENRKKLQALDEEDWDSLYWDNGKLSGIDDLMKI